MGDRAGVRHDRRRGDEVDGKEPPVTSTIELLVAEANEPSHQERQPWLKAVPDWPLMPASHGQEL
jgi:hypothetical protein